MNINNKKGLVKRFSKQQVELATKISNDIAEDIDCGESHEKLKIAVAYWADVACVEAQKRAALESRLVMLNASMKLCVALLREG